MTEEQRNSIILQLQDIEERELKVVKFDEGTQTYYSDEEEAKRKVPQPVIMIVPEDTRSLDEVADLLKSRLEGQKELEQKNSKAKHILLKTQTHERKDRWNSNRK